MGHHDTTWRPRILYHSDRMNYYLVTVQMKGSFSTHRGQLPFDQMAGREFGDSIRTHLGFLFYLLKPGLSDLAMKVKRARPSSIQGRRRNAPLRSGLPGVPAGN